MTALPGGVVSTLRDDVGDPVFIVSEWFDPATGVMHDIATITSRGTVTGALIVDNMTGKAQKLNAAGQTFNVNPNGATLTAAQLAALTPPVMTIEDLAGVSPVLA